MVLLLALTSLTIRKRGQDQLAHYQYQIPKLRKLNLLTQNVLFTKSWLYLSNSTLVPIQVTFFFLVLISFFARPCSESCLDFGGAFLKGEFVIALEAGWLLAAQPVCFPSIWGCFPRVAPLWEVEQSRVLPRLY